MWRAIIAGLLALVLMVLIMIGAELALVGMGVA
jgi:hypothetical protein